tara:strand:+ start:4344 stop:4685 length:342 start_codon:yes stop_codon:yes gene_type:complete
MIIKNSISGLARLFLSLALHSITYLIVLSIIIAGVFPPTGEALEGVVISTIFISPIGYFGMGALLILILIFCSKLQILTNIRYVLATGIIIGIISACINDYLVSLSTMLRSIF